MQMDNSRLLREYVFFPSMCFPEDDGKSILHLMTLAVKKWASSAEVNDTRNGGLSNYTFLNLVVFFLQQMKLIPNLQDQHRKGNMRECSIEMDGTRHEYRFQLDATPTKEQAELGRQFCDKPGDLLRSFFEFYVEFPWKTHAVSIKHGYPVAKRPNERLKIFDPLKVDRDLADVLRSHKERKQLLKAFKNARHIFRRNDLSEEDRLASLMGTV